MERGKKRQLQKSIERVDLDVVVLEEGRNGASKEEEFQQHHKAKWLLFLWISDLLRRVGREVMKKSGGLLCGGGVPPAPC